MEEKEKQTSIPYFVHEGAMARMERNNRRLLIALIAVLVALLLNNVAWLCFENAQRARQANIEVTDGVQQQPDGGAD